MPKARIKQDWPRNIGVVLCSEYQIELEESMAHMHQCCGQKRSNPYLETYRSILVECNLANQKSLSPWASHSLSLLYSCIKKYSTSGFYFQERRCTMASQKYDVSRAKASDINISNLLGNNPPNQHWMSQYLAADLSSPNVLNTNYEHECRKGSQFPFFHTHLKPLWSSFLLMKFLSLESTIGSVNSTGIGRRMERREYS